MDAVRLLMLFGSPRKDGNTSVLVQECLKGAVAEKAEVKQLDIVDFDIAACTECLACFHDGQCVIKDDMIQIYSLLLEADIVVLAAPIFFYGVPGCTKAMIDRSQALWARKYVLGDPDLGREGKRRKGFYLSVGGTKGPKMFEGSILTARYFFDAFNARYAGELLVRGVDAKGDIFKQPERLTEAHEAGRNLVANFFDDP